MKIKMMNLTMTLMTGLLVLSPTTMASPVGSMKVHMLRLSPGDDPRLKLEAYVKEKKLKAALVISAVGSLTEAKLRFANQEKTETLKGHFEILSLSGTLGAESGSHLHLAIADEKGKTTGGHLVEGSKIYTTLEIALGELTETQFTREVDPATTYKELKVK